VTGLGELKADVRGLVPPRDTVGSIGSAMAIMMTWAGVLPVDGIVSPDAYFPNVLPPDRVTVRSFGYTYSTPEPETVDEMVTVEPGPPSRMEMPEPATN